MKVIVEMFGDLRKYMKVGQERIELEIDEGATVHELFQKIGMEEGEVWGASVNGEWVPKSTIVPADSRVLIFPPIVGG